MSRGRSDNNIIGMRSVPDLFEDPDSFWSWWASSPSETRQKYIWPQDLSYVDASNQDLTGVNWSGRQGRSMNLSGANLSNANLAFINLSGSDLTLLLAEQTKFIAANLSFIKAENANFSGAVFDEATIHDFNINNAEMKNSTGIVSGYLGKPYNLNAVPVWITVCGSLKQTTAVRKVAEIFRLNIDEARIAVDEAVREGQVQLYLASDKFYSSFNKLSSSGVILHQEQPSLPVAQKAVLSIDDSVNPLELIKSLYELAQLNDPLAIDSILKAKEVYNDLRINKKSFILIIKNPEIESNLEPLKRFTESGGSVVLV